MYPVLLEFNLGNNLFRLSSYRFFGTLSAIFLLLVALYYLKSFAFSFNKMFFYPFITTVSFLIGARLVYAILYLPKILENPSELFKVGLQNFTLFGGLAASLITWWLICQKEELPFWQLNDKLVIHAGIGLAIMRTGCFMNGCCFGKVTNMPWGIQFPQGSFAHLAQISNNPFAIIRQTVPVHPTQLYEIAAALIASLFAFLILKQKRYKPNPGLATAIFGLILSIGRFITFFFRHFPEAGNISNLIRGPIIYGFSILIFSYWIYKVEIVN